MFVSIYIYVCVCMHIYLLFVCAYILINEKGKRQTCVVKFQFDVRVVAAANLAPCPIDGMLCIGQYLAAGSGCKKKEIKVVHRFFTPREREGYL